MKILVLGNSSIFNRKVLPALIKFKNVSIEVASKRQIKKNGLYAKTYNTYQAAIQKTKAKIVYISLINSKHYFWAKKCLEQKKHVIVDKPITINSRELLNLTLLAKKHKLFISEAIVFQYHKQFKALVNKIDLKKFTSISTSFHIPKLDKSNFRNSSKLGGGCYQDMSPYAAYLIKFFFKNQKPIIKKKKHSFYQGNSNSFSFEAKTSKVNLKCSFSFNKSYKNLMKINSDKKEFQIEYVFSPPIDRDLILLEFNKKTNKNKKILFKTQNTFYTYFDMIFKIIKKKKFDFFLNQLDQTAKIKNEII